MKRNTKPVAAKPAITTRLNVTSLEHEVDLVMRRLPKSGKIDLSTPGTREVFRKWLLDFAETLAWHLQMDFAKASALGMEQMSKLIRDPKYGEIVTEREERVGDAGKPELVVRVARARRKEQSRRRLAAKGIKL